MSRADAAAAAEKIALEYAATIGIEGKLIGVKPDRFSTEHHGKTAVHWIAVFELVIGGAALDGPLVANINLETGSASLAA